MLRSLKQIEGYTIRAVDGDIGKVNDFYLDDFDWIVRYLVAAISEDASTALEKARHARLVLLTPLVLMNPDDRSRVIPVTLNREMIAKSPDLNTSLPFSRQNEIELHNYYQWPFYWLTPGVASYPLIELAQEIKETAGLPQTGGEPRSGENPHLQSLREVIGYGIAARDGEIGHVSDFIVDDVAWKIEYILVNTGNWLPGRKVIISPQWKKEINRSNATMSLDLSKQTIQNSPEFDPDQPLSEDYREKLDEHYRKGED